MTKLTTVTPSKVPTHITRAPMAKLSKEARQCIGKYTPRIRAANEAQARSYTAPSKEPYRTGDGDVIQVTRPGSMVAYSLPSNRA